jgi:chromate reductase, NAD(P)H dehydrogenase (quinone)
MPDHPILILSGTNRPASNTLKVAKLILSQYRQHNLSAELYDLTDLPPTVFLPSVYAAKPPEFQAIQNQILTAAGLHVVTPEYNGSFPGILKYFIDLLRFPQSFERKPVAFVGISNGAFGGLRPVEQLQMVFGYRNAHVYPDRVFIAGIQNKLDPDGKLNDPALTDRIAKQTHGFAKFAGAIAAH